ncbi:ATP phosphoribosyltransferase regulatory subunit [Patescibacteria group bacterium]|nr:ATP phosphoribosyltransferase regulatory subunit [Patescibacteria group bacterium]MBU1519382.1 ATP phosphoribosyltransferase regulatory subunit [Patescibacteria group bacterium]MBU2416435.1 ATP phosphoribosyltransferase regulatory subunit [Patescibacteria group bacterium]MBU2461100.1 ATP phosphoribosyltransferase regulatory subunit [Patescibacteria group bacterium]
MPKKLIKKNTISSVPGTRDLQETDYFNYQGLFEKASEIALYYGFNPIELPILEQETLYSAGTKENNKQNEQKLHSFQGEDKTQIILRKEAAPSITRIYVEKNLQTTPQPTMFYHYGSFFYSKFAGDNKTPVENRRFGLDILGTNKSIADATIIKVIMIILNEAGFNDLYIQINSIGDKTSQQLYKKALVSYYTKNISSLCARCKKQLKINPFTLLLCNNFNCQNIKIGAPESLAFLNTPMKAHFREVLEYLDAMNIEYRINNSLIGEFNYYNQTVFQVMENKNTKTPTTTKKTDDKQGKANTQKNTAVLATGGRYDNLAKQLKLKKILPAVGATINIDRIINSPSSKAISSRINKKIKIYFIQLSFEAKQKSLAIIEILRCAHIPIMHSLTKDRLSAQLALAEKLNIPYTIILGQREALDNTVIIRNMSTCAQDTVPVDQLTTYIKNKIK